MSLAQHLRRPRARLRAIPWIVAVAALAGLPAAGQAATTTLEA